MRSVIARTAFVLSAFLVTFLLTLPLAAQSRTNSSGTGGIHEIRGKVYSPSGKTIEIPVEVELQSISNFSTLKLFTDRDGAYSFRNLAPGNYSVLVKAGEQYEDAHEYVTIDAQVQGVVRIAPVPKVVTVPVYLQLKRGVVLRNEVINAKWSTVPKAAIEHVRKGIELAQSAKPKEAEEEFERAVQLAPNFAPAYTELAKLRLSNANLDGAIEAAKKAIQRDESDFEAHLSLGVAYLNKKRYDLAEPELVNAAYINKGDVRPHYYLGMLFATKQDLDVAQKAFETVRELDGGKSLPNIHKYLARIYSQKGMADEALREFETYLKLAPKAPDVDRIKKEMSDLKAKHVKNAFV